MFASWENCQNIVVTELLFNRQITIIFHLIVSNLVKMKYNCGLLNKNAIRHTLHITQCVII